MSDAYNYMIAHMHDGCCAPWPFGHTNRQPSIYLGEYARKNVYQVVCELVNGPKPTSEHEAAHSCGKRLQGCFNASCLRWATPTENAADRERHGNTVKGEKNKGGGKLTESQVREIKRLRREGNPITKISVQFSVDTTMVSKICRGILWSHVE